MMKLNRSTLTSVVFIGFMLVIAGMAASWASGQIGTIPVDLVPGQIVVIIDEPGRFVGLTDKDGVRAVVLDRAGTRLAQTWSDDGTKVMEAIDAFLVDNADSAVLPTFALSPYAPTITNEILEEIANGTRVANSDGTYDIDSNEVDVMCLNNSGAWSGIEVAETKITATRVESILRPGEYVDIAISIDFKTGQHGVCAVFVCENNFENADVQPRADITPDEAPETGGVSGDS